MWQEEIEREVRRNGVRLAVERGNVPLSDAEAGMDHALVQMNSAFPDARLPTGLWGPLVPGMTNEPKDRHVMAAAVRARATHVVTSNLRDFPPGSSPTGMRVVHPDVFLLDRLAHDPELVISAVRAMARRHRRPAHTVEQLAELMAEGELIPGFGKRLRELVLP